MKIINSICHFLDSIIYTVESRGTINRALLSSISENILFLLKLLKIKHNHYLHHKIYDVYINKENFVISKHLNVPLLSDSILVFEQDPSNKYRYLHSKDDGVMVLGKPVLFSNNSEFQIMYVYVKPYYQIKKLCRGKETSTEEIRKIMYVTKEFLIAIQTKYNKLVARKL
jgi:hypothetical protein